MQEGGLDEDQSDAAAARSLASAPLSTSPATRSVLPCALNGGERPQLIAQTLEGGKRDRDGIERQDHSQPASPSADDCQDVRPLQIMNTTTPPPADASVIDGKYKMIALLIAIGEKLGFDAMTEIEASEAAWVDVVWFDKRFTNSRPPGKKPRLRRTAALPIAAFEVENKTGLNAKHVKGSVSNLNNSGAQMGVIVIGNESLALLKKQAKHSKKHDVELEKELSDRAYRWVYAEAQPKGRVVLMSERELIEWAVREGVSPG